MNEQEATLYRALAARANYSAIDRPDLAFATKELCRGFTTPTKLSIEKLKHLARYVIHHPRVVWKFDRQPSVAELCCYAVTDFAGCMQTRRSISGGAIMRGHHLVQMWSTTQTTVALSSGEAELSGICRGALKGIGTRSLADGVGMKLSLTVLTDATTAINICRRRGLGKIRHLAVADLWVQVQVKTKEFLLNNVAGKANPADMLTKHDAGTMLRNLAAMGLELKEGRHALAPTPTHAIVLIDDVPYDNFPIFRSHRSQRGSLRRGEEHQLRPTAGSSPKPRHQQF